MAASYGTIAAQAYLRQHPHRVRSAFLVGVATPGIKQPLLFARAAQHALGRLFEDCAADEACRGAFPRLKSEFDAVLARFSSGAVKYLPHGRQVQARYYGHQLDSPCSGACFQTSSRRDRGTGSM